MKILLILLLISTPALSAEITYFKPVDGDTFKVDAREIKDELLKLNYSIRIKGIDTPEKGWRAKCKKEAILGEMASEFTKKALKEAEAKKLPIAINNVEHDKYGGRLLADVYINGKLLASELIEAGLARKYHGEKKASWCK